MKLTIEIFCQIPPNGDEGFHDESHMFIFKKIKITT